MLPHVVRIGFLLVAKTYPSLTQRSHSSRAVVIHGARIEVVRNVKSFIYVRHNKNTYMPPADEWNSLIPVPFPPFVAGADATFYKSLVENQEVQESKMVSAINDR